MVSLSVGAEIQYEEELPLHFRGLILWSTENMFISFSLKLKLQKLTCKFSAQLACVDRINYLIIIS